MTTPYTAREGKVLKIFQSHLRLGEREQRGRNAYTMIH